MSTVEEIRTAIEMLSLEERAQMIAELCGWSDDDWDRQMKADAAAGKFAALNRDADVAYAVGPGKVIVSKARRRHRAPANQSPTRTNECRAARGLGCQTRV